MASSPSPSSPNPRRVEAGRLNRLKRGPLTPEGLERLRQAALSRRMWEQATGPRTPQGKARAAANGKARKKGEGSARAVRRSVVEVTGLVGDMARMRAMVAELLAGIG